MNVIEARNISKSYKEKVIFQNLSFVVNEGEIVGIILKKSLVSYFKILLL